MKKFICLFLAAVLMAGFGACAKEETEDQEDEIPEGPVRTVYEGNGWSFEYDPALFEDSGDMTVTYIGEDSPMPVYLSVQSCPDNSAQEVAEGLALQSGSGDTKVEDAVVGRDGLAAKYVFIERPVGEIGEVTQYQRFYAVDLAPGFILIEACSYDGAPAAATEGLEALLASFKRE